MKASAFEFRFRFWIHVVIFTLGFWVPWDRALHLDPRGANSHTWGALASLLAGTGVMGIGRAFDLLLVAATLLAALAAWLRTWGAAYIGSGIVKDSAMHGAAVVADGPYRFVRNPLYLGTFLHTLALALLMPPSGAVFTVVLIGVFQMRLILAEEPFLEEKLGASYVAYKALVPRIVPALRPRVAASGQKAHWGHAVLGEIYFIAMVGAFAVAGWSYNALLLVRCVLIALGVSMVARAFITKEPAAS